MIGGTLTVETSGDYGSVSGDELVKKLIFRRLISSPGDFFHLPEYGLGLSEKEIVHSANLVQLKAEVERQILLEREVEEASVRLTIDQDILTIQARVRLKNGNQLDITVPTEAQITL